MSYISQSDIELQLGFGASDFVVDGRMMTADEWDALVQSVIAQVDGLINRYCQVTTFEPHLVSELHNGRGNMPETWYERLPDQDHEYIPFEQPVASVDTVHVDAAPPTSPPEWIPRLQREDGVAGDYRVVDLGGFTYIRFHQNIPPKGIGNVRIEYTAGFQLGSPELSDLNQIAIRIAANLFLYTKKIQEANTVRGAHVEDYARMFDLGDGVGILTKPIKDDLERYVRRRYTLGA